MASTTNDRRTSSAPAQGGWRIVDIVVAAVIAVAFGVIFWAWGFVWNAAEPAFVAFPPARGLLYGVWLLPAVLGALIIRKPGAALFTETLAAIVSALLGSQWGLVVVVYGVFQGLAAEIPFALGYYRSFGKVRAIIAGALAGLTAATMDRILYYPEFNALFTGVWAGVVTVSAALVAGVGSYLLMRRLADTGVLSPFASGASARQV